MNSQIQSGIKIFLRGEGEANKLISVKVNSKPEYYNHTIITNSGNNRQWILKPPGKKLGNRKITQSQNHCPTRIPIIFEFKREKFALQWKNHTDIIFTLTSPVIEYIHILHFLRRTQKDTLLPM